MRPIRLNDLMDGRWWAALAVALAFVVVARTGTVGAPAEAGAPRVNPIEPASSVSPMTAAMMRIDELELELQLEQERNALLLESHDHLTDEVERIRERVRTELAGVRESAPVPLPIDAIYTLGAE